MPLLLFSSVSPSSYSYFHLITASLLTNRIAIGWQIRSYIPAMIRLCLCIRLAVEKYSSFFSFLSKDSPNRSNEALFLTDISISFILPISITQKKKDRLESDLVVVTINAYVCTM